VKIAHVTDCYEPRLGGIECQVSQLADRQQRAGHTVTVVTCVAGPSATATGPEVLRPVRASAGRPSGTQIRYWDTGRQLGAFGRRSFDAVHVHLSTFSPLAFGAARASAAKGIPTVVTAHSLLTGWTSAYRALASVSRARTWPVTWTAVSGAAAASLQAVLGSDVPVQVVHNAVDASSWAVARREPRAGLLRIASVGRLAARKRPLPLVRILARARSLTPGDVGLTAVLAGDGPQRAAVVRGARRRDVPWLDLPGTLTPDEIRSLHASSDLYIAPARRESFGIAALEAHCAGLPVLGFRGTGLADFVDDGRTGLLVADDEAMAQAIAQLARQPQLLARLAGGVGSVPDHVTWESVMASWQALYRQPDAAAQVAHVERIQQR
jgi:glycosyltransferase involved in cell wall biosynthesis